MISKNYVLTRCLDPEGVTPMKLTIQQIADQLGISKTTVHRALSGTGRISPETKKKVQELAESMGYTPNSVAQSLRSKHTMTVGLVLRGMMVGHYYAQILAGIEEEASKAGYMIHIACSGDDAKTEAAILQNFCRRQVDGVIIAPVEGSFPENYVSLSRHGIPFVFIDKYLETVPADVVTADGESGVKAAVQYLVSTGRKRIAFLNGYERNSITTRQRLQGYHTQLKKEGISFSRVIESDYFGKEDTLCGYSAIRQVLQQKTETEQMDALLCVNDSLAFGAMRAIREAGLQIPKDIAVIGNNNDSMTEYVFPRLTTLSQPKLDMGRLSMKLLLQRIKAQEETDEETKTSDKEGFYSFPVSLIIRDST